MKKILSIAIVLSCGIIILSCRDKSVGNDYYWGHGFGMGYGSGCFETQNLLIGDLGLTKDQAAKIENIDLKYRQLYFDNRGNFDKIDSLRKEHKNEIDAVLNVKQKENYNSVYTNRWGKWGRGYGRRHMGNFYGHGYGMGYGAGCYNNSDAMIQNVGLSQEQVKKIDGIDSKYRDLYFKNRGDYKKIELLREEHRSAIEKVLTPEQRKKYSEVYDYRWKGWGPGGHMGSGMMGY